jgi:predicted RNase H-like HicB family nuclease
MATVTTKNDERTLTAAAEIRLHLLITRDDDSTFSAVVLNLPGAGSCGDTEVEAIENAIEATRGVLEVYEENGEAIPWKDTAADPIPAGAQQKWVVLDA